MYHTNYVLKRFLKNVLFSKICLEAERKIRTFLIILIKSATVHFIVFHIHHGNLNDVAIS